MTPAQARAAISAVRSSSRPTPSTTEIAEVLARCHSRKEAAAALGIPATTLERLCREQALVSLYERLVERGALQRGGGKLRGDKGRASTLTPMRRWSFYWRTKGETVCVWPEKEIDAVTEQEAIDVFMTLAPRVTLRIDLSAVEVTK